ncbi:hypothetical protein SAMN05720762_1031, partial [Fibrobacter sp. UWH4]
TTKIKSAIPKVFSTLLKNFQPPFSSPATLYPGFIPAHKEPL